MNITQIFTSVQEVRFSKVLRFIIPTYLTSLFNTLYTIVDGIFVSQYVGTDALAAINIVYPIVNILTGIALVFAVGGSAMATISIGGNHIQRAKQEFSISMLTASLLGVGVSVLIFLNLSSILDFLGATSSTMEYCKVYGVIWLLGVPAVIGKELFTFFIRADGSPSFSFFLAAAGGVTNIIFDYIFIKEMGLGILGAGLATILGLCISCLLGLFYFVRRSRFLSFTLKKLPLTFIPGCIVNGSSEFINQVAIAITTIVFNRTALQLVGEDGIAAVTIIMYLQFIFVGVYFGYSMGIAPLISYFYGNEKRDICKKLEGYSYLFFGVSPIIMYAIAYCTAPFTVSFFAPSHTPVYTLALTGMKLYGLGYLFSGLSIFTAIRFTAYGRGHVSAVITFLRSFALLLLFLVILPPLWGMTGVWLAVPMAEAITLLVTGWFIYLASKEY